jgi:hypothetical protein
VEPTKGEVWVPKIAKLPAPAALISKRTAETPDAGGAAPSVALALTSTEPAT